MLAAGLSTERKLIILCVMAIFVAFALICSFVLPRRNPDFPGRRGLMWFVPVSILLFVAMVTTIVVVAKEPAEEAEAAETPGAETSAAETEPRGTVIEGDPTAGQRIYAAQGCGSCHTLADAGSTGQVGPNLDEAKPPYELVVERVTNGKAPMPAYEGQLSEEQIQDVAAYVVQATGGS